MHAEFKPMKINYTQHRLPTTLFWTNKTLLYQMQKRLLFIDAYQKLNPHHNTNFLVHQLSATPFTH